MRVSTVAFFTLAALAAQDLSLEASANSGCQSPMVPGQEPEATNCFATSSPDEPARLESISPPETLANEQFTPESSSLQFKTTAKVDSRLSVFGQHTQPAKNQQEQQGLMAQGQNEPAQLAVATITPTAGPLAFSPTQFGEVLSNPISFLSALLLDLTLSPIGAIAFLLIVKRFLVGEIVSEVKQRLIELEDLESQINTARLTVDCLKAELEAEIGSVSQSAQQKFNQFTKEITEEQAKIKQVENLKAEWIGQLQTIVLELHQAKDYVIQQIRQTASTQIVNSTTLSTTPDSESQNQPSAGLNTASEVLKRQERQLPVTADDYIREGMELFRQGNYPEAIACYEKAIAIQPDHVQAWYNKGKILSGLQRYEEAVAAYDKVIDLNPDHNEIWLSRGNLLLKLHRYEDAIASYDQAIELKPDNHDAWGNRGHVLVKLQRYKEALAAYRKALDIEPKDHELWHIQGNLLGKLQRPEDAIKSYDHAVKIKPDKYESWYNRGNYLVRLHQHEEALKSYDRAIEIKPETYEFWHNRGAVLGKMQKYEAAIASYEKAIILNPNNYESWQNRGNLLEKLHRYEDAITSYDRAIELKPDDPTLWYYCGNALEKLQRYDEAIASYDRAIKIKPDKYEAWYNRGNLLARLQKYQEAISSLGQAVQIQQNLIQTIPMSS